MNITCYIVEILKIAEGVLSSPIRVETMRRRRRIQSVIVPSPTHLTFHHVFGKRCKPVQSADGITGYRNRKQFREEKNDVYEIEKCVTTSYITASVCVGFGFGKQHFFPKTIFVYASVYHTMEKSYQVCV